MDLTMKSECVFPLDAHHTAEYIAFASDNGKFQLGWKQRLLLLLANASNKKAISLINKQKQIGCFAHIICLIPDTLYTLPITKNIIAKVKTFVDLARRSVMASVELKRFQIRDSKSERTTLKFIQNCPTR